jgi:hypothetical protein
MMITEPEVLRNGSTFPLRSTNSVNVIPAGPLLGIRLIVNESPICGAFAPVVVTLSRNNNPGDELRRPQSN